MKTIYHMLRQVKTNVKQIKIASDNLIKTRIKIFVLGGRFDNLFSSEGWTKNPKMS